MSRQDSSNPLVQQLLSHIDQDWTTSCTHDGRTSTFVSQASIRHFLDVSPQIRDLIVAGCGEQSGYSTKFIIQNCPIALCILLRLGKGEYISHFLGHAGLWDRELPFFAKPEDFPYVPQEPTFFEVFQEEQWRFFPVTIYQSEAIKFQKERPLPIVESTLLKKSHTAKLFRVRIHQECDKTDLQKVPDKHKDYALKTYTGKRAQSYYRTEVENFAKLCLYHREPPEGLIRFHCGFEHDDTFNLLLDYATFGSLRDLFGDEDNETPAPEPPSSGQDIVRLWEQFSSCIQALNRIHELDLSPDDPTGSRVFQGWHQDIRPENILIHRQGDDAEPHDYRFMLGDLGLSHFTRMCRSNDDPESLDTVGTRTYGAPELYRNTDFDATRRLFATRAIDVWSLGCVMLDICVWIVRGRQYLEAFGSRRDAMNKSLGCFAGDCFHDGQQPHPNVSTVVQDEMNTLPDDIRVSDYITEPVIDIVKRMLRPDPKQRPTAPEILADMGVAINSAKERCVAWYARNKHRSGSSTQRQSGLVNTASWNREDSQALRSPVTPSIRIDTRSNILSSSPFSGHWVDIGADGAASAARNEAMEESGLDIQHFPTAPAIFTSNGRVTAGEHLESIGGRPHASTFPERQNPDFLMADAQMQQPGHHQSLVEDAQEIRRSYDIGRNRKSRRKDVPYLSRDDVIKWRDSRKKLFGHKTPLKFDEYRNWLKQRDHVFIIDDSRSMKPYKEHVTALLGPLIYTVKEYDPDGVEVLFTVSRSTQQSRKSGVLIDEVERHKFEGKTDISIRLGSILRKYRVNIDDHKTKRQSARPMSIYILTNGVWEGGQDAQTPIRDLTMVLKHYGYDRKQLGIQFISFGNDGQGLQRLADLDQFGKQPDVDLDIVDTESSFGNVWKMLLGAIDETFDDEFSDGEAE